jgi:hypothetical protein
LGNTNRKVKLLAAALLVLIWSGASIGAINNSYAFRPDSKMEIPDKPGNLDEKMPFLDDFMQIFKYCPGITGVGITTDGDLAITLESEKYLTKELIDKLNEYFLPRLEKAKKAGFKKFCIIVGNVIFKFKLK